MALQRTKNEIRTRLEFKNLRVGGCKNDFFYGIDLQK